MLQSGDDDASHLVSTLLNSGANFFFKLVVMKVFYEPLNQHIFPTQWTVVALFIKTTNTFKLAAFKHASISAKETET